MRHLVLRPLTSWLSALLLALLLVPASAAGARAQAAPPVIQPRSIDDCERIKGDLAYNQCLSLFGPAAHSRPASAASSEAAAGPARVTQAEEAAPERRYSRRGRRRGGYHRGGRQRASFTIGRGSRSSGHRGHRRRR